MLYCILGFLLICFVESISGGLNLFGWCLAIIEWIGNLPTIWGIVVLLAPFVLAFVLSKIIKAIRK